MLIARKTCYTLIQLTMFRRFLPHKWRTNIWLLRFLDGTALFIVLLVAIWLATQRRGTAELILLLLLYIITINFSLPGVQGVVGLVPIVSVTSLLIMDLETAVSLAVVSIVLAEFARPLWEPIWQNIEVRRPGWKERVSTALVYLAAITSAGLVYRELGGQIALSAINNADLAKFGALALTYSIVYFVLALLFWLLHKRPLRKFLQDHTFSILAVTLLSQPFALFGGLVFVLGGLPIFVIFCLSVLFISLLLWLFWQRNFVMHLRLTQFATLNSVGASLRETLELPKVLERTLRTIANLIPAEQYIVALVDENDQWQRPYITQSGTIDIKTFIPNDLMRWVAAEGRVLELNPQNMHFATQHKITLPDPNPDAWLGVPLRSTTRTIGVLGVLRLPPHGAFSRWSREVLLAVGGQASAAIQNARLYSETVRLYNLTDEALAQRLKQLSALLNAMQEGVVMIDTNGRIVLVNTFAAQLLGQSARELRNQPLDSNTAAMVLGYDPTELSGLLQLLCQGQIPESLRITFETNFSYEDKVVRFLERSEEAVIAKEGQIIGWLMLFRDVTEEYELAEQRTDLTRMIVHDLRNPVTTFISNMYLVDSILPNDNQPTFESTQVEAIQTAVANARQSSYDMLDMVDSLMDINRMEAGQVTIEVDGINLARIAEKVVKRLQVLAAQRHITLEFHAEPELPAVWADEDMIRRVLVNIIDNAIKFTPEGGHVACEIVTESALDPTHEPGARCIINDSGPGIPAEDKDKIFDRYMRTNQGGARVRGTGLGLTFCKLAVVAHNGRIWVEDAPGGGSQFVFTLPGIPILFD